MDVPSNSSSFQKAGVDFVTWTWKPPVCISKSHLVLAHHTCDTGLFLGSFSLLILFCFDPSTSWWQFAVTASSACLQEACIWCETSKPAVLHSCIVINGLGLSDTSRGSGPSALGSKGYLLIRPTDWANTQLHQGTQDFINSMGMCK